MTRLVRSCLPMGVSSFASRQRPPARVAETALGIAGLTLVGLLLGESHAEAVTWAVGISLFALVVDLAIRPNRAPVASAHALYAEVAPAPRTVRVGWV